MGKIGLFSILFLISSCGLYSIKQDDLESWMNQPVAKLDSHSFFITLPMNKTQTEDGTEIRVYRNGGNFRTSASCHYGVCTSNTSEVVCNNIFHIRDGLVKKYQLVGKCKTDQTVRPEY